MNRITIAIAAMLIAGAAQAYDGEPWQGLMGVMLAIFALENALDGWTTYQIFRFGGIEENPAIAWLMKHLGVYWALVVWKVSPVIGAWAALYIWHAPWQLLAPVELLYLWVIAHNERQRRKHIRS